MGNRIVIVDYGMGNLQSVVNAFEYVGAKVKLSRRIDDIVNARALVVPGQGAFRDCIGNIKRFDLAGPLTDMVVKKKKPFFGICMGMEVLADSSTEGGNHKGLGWVEGTVEKIDTKGELKLPHMGWNDVNIDKKDMMLNGLSPKPCFFFAHSYELRPKKKNLTILTCMYGSQLVAGIRQDNIFAVQFHPEKSQVDGLRLIKNFVISCAKN
jgi:imidazole glycerol-phosphate synthase subunit HisH